jgi:hypothetical protein
VRFALVGAAPPPASIDRYSPIGAGSSKRRGGFTRFPRLGPGPPFTAAPAIRKPTPIVAGRCLGFP